MGVGGGNADDDVDNDNNARLFASFNRVRFIAKTMAIKIWTMTTTDAVAVKWGRRRRFLWLKGGREKGHRSSVMIVFARM